ncbi:MAG: hypothetical protein KDD15_16890 [Lewinella sp.]|nr:hypothetical protein [Lewinella sp.]
MKLPFLFLLICYILQPFSASAQKFIYFDNPSFEGPPADATVPVGWLPCEEETTPDILPGFWGVYREASEGTTFVGLITRHDGTWESITQRLSKPLEPEECYSFTLDLARSVTYNQYNRPIRLKIWGSGTKCEKRQLLLETDLIRHANWKTYEVGFYPKDKLNYIIFEAAYPEGIDALPGNILIDNLSPIKKCPRA